jgi:hypothetical protein
MGEATLLDGHVFPAHAPADGPKGTLDQARVPGARVK